MSIYYICQRTHTHTRAYNNFRHWNLLIADIFPFSYFVWNVCFSIVCLEYHFRSFFLVWFEYSIDSVELMMMMMCVCVFVYKNTHLVQCLYFRFDSLSLSSACMFTGWFLSIVVDDFQIHDNFCTTQLIRLLLFFFLLLGSITIVGSYYSYTTIAVFVIVVVTATAAVFRTICDKFDSLAYWCLHLFGWWF